MQQFFLRRLLRAVIVFWGILTIVFVVLRLSGDPVAMLVAPDTPPAEVEKVRHAWGFDAPLSTQYLVFIKSVLVGDFGRSLRFGEPAMDLVRTYLPPTLELAIVSICLAVIVAVPIGILSATRPNSIYDTLAMCVALIGQSMPTFLLGIALILVFAVQWRVLPTGGRGEWYQLILPSVTLAAWAMAAIARLARSATLEVLRRDYIRTARGKGLSERRLLIVHVLRNVAIPIITIIGLQFGALLGGAVVVETVFAWPGLGRLIVQAISNRDYPVVQAGVFVIAVGFILINTLVDLLYGALDPRVRYS